jgi:hypothetical protein
MPLGNRSRRKDILQPFRIFYSLPRGGHFAALEEPALLTEDMRAFFRPLRG